MKVAVKVLPKPEVLDKQGRAVQDRLQNQSQRKILSNCRVGKWIELEFDSTDKESVLKQAEEMAKKLLHNPLIENFELEIL